MGQRDDFIKRLEQLNGGPLRFGDRRPDEVAAIERNGRDKHENGQTPTVKSSSPISYPRMVPHTTPPTPPPVVQPVQRAFVALNDALPGQDVTVPERGRLYLIETPLARMTEDRSLLRAAMQRALADASSPLQQRFLARYDKPMALDNLLFVDLETTGLSHSPLFLIGTMVWENDDFVVKQYLARHYGEEAAVIAAFFALAKERGLLISFNGKSFDMPYVRNRSIANGVPIRLELPHFDLLHESRRVWKRCLPNCKLQTLEQMVCGHPPRHGDIPGSQIPEAYHSFVRNGNALRLAKIIHHNLLDLVTLAELLTKLPPLES